MHKKIHKTSLNNILDFVEEHVREINHFIANHRFSQDIREELQTQLVWLKYRSKLNYTGFDLIDLQNSYNWVIENVNTKLELPEEEQFEFLEAA